MLGKMAGLAGVLVVVGAVGLATQIGRGNPWNVAHAVVEQVDVNQTRSIPAAGITGIETNTDIGALHIVPALGNEIRVHVHGSVTKAQWAYTDWSLSRHGNVMDLTLKRKHHWDLTMFVPSFGDLTIDVTVPRRMYDEIVVHAGTSDVFMQSLKATHLTVDEGTGNVQLLNVDASMDLNTGTGNVDIRTPKLPGEVQAATGTGDVRITTEQRLNNVTYQLSSGTGTIEFQGQTGSHQLSGTVGAGQSLLNLSTGTGDIRVGSGS